MGEERHVPLGVGFYPEWWHKNYGLSFGREYYYDPELRVQTQAKMQQALYERFGDLGLGHPDPEPKPLITFGMVMLPAVFGCEIVYKEGDLPWAIPANLSKEDCLKLKKPDLTKVQPMKDMLTQIDYLQGKYGRVMGDINTTGIQNLALKIRGDEFYLDYYRDPEFCHQLLKFCAEVIIELWQLVYPITGSGAVDVTPMCDPSFYCVANCTIVQISGATYEKFLLGPENMLARACRPFGIHHCGSMDEVVEQYAKVENLAFVEAGFGTDFARARRILGPEVAFNARLSPVMMQTASPDEVAAAVRQAIDQGAPLDNFSIDTVGLTYGVPDENVRTALITAREYGRLS